MLTNYKYFIHWLCQVLIVFLGGIAVALAAEDFKRQEYRVKEQDSIRSIILTHTCITSMPEYIRARKVFGTLNPQIFYSHQLQAGSLVTVPIFQRPSPGCLAFRPVQIMRVEFESRGNKEQVYIYLDGPVWPDLFTLPDQSQTRVICDFDGALPGHDLEREYEVPGRLVRKIRVGHETKPFVRGRVVLETDPALTGEILSRFVEHESVFVLTIVEQEKNSGQAD